MISDLVDYLLGGRNNLANQGPQGERGRLILEATTTAEQREEIARRGREELDRQAQQRSVRGLVPAGFFTRQNRG